MDLPATLLEDIVLDLPLGSLVVLWELFVCVALGFSVIHGWVCSLHRVDELLESTLPAHALDQHRLKRRTDGCRAS